MRTNILAAGWILAALLPCLAAENNLLQEADQLQKSGKDKQASAIWEKIVKQDHTPEGEVAAYRLLEIPFLSGKLTPAKQKRQSEAVMSAILHAKSDFMKAAGCQLLMTWEPVVPDWDDRLSTLIQSRDLRCVLAAHYAWGIASRRKERPAVALEHFKKALALYDSLSASQETGVTKKLDPILPWTRPELAGHVADMEKKLRDLSDTRIHAEAIRHYAADRLPDALPLFQKIIDSFQSSEFRESADFHAAACKLRIAAANRTDKKIDVKSLEAPLLSYLKQYPENSGRVRGEAWKIIGDARFREWFSPLEEVRSAWEEAAAEFLVQDNRNLEQEQLFFRLGMLAHYRKQFQEAILHYKRAISSLPTEKKGGFPNNCTALIRYAEKKESPVPEEKAIMEQGGDSRMNRLLFLLEAALTARKAPLVEQTGDAILHSPRIRKRTPAQIAYAEYYLACAMELEGSFEAREKTILQLEKLADRHAKTVFAPRILFSLAHLQYATATYCDRGNSTIERILKNYPGSSVQEDALLQIAFSLYVKNNFKAAERYYRQFLAQFPNSQQASHVRARLDNMAQEAKAIRDNQKNLSNTKKKDVQ